MLSSDKNLENFGRLFTEARRYTDMRLDMFQRSSVEKLSTILAGLIMGAIILFVSILVIIFISASCVFAIAEHVGGYAVASLIVGLVHLVLMLSVIIMRRRWIVGPIHRTLARLFFGQRAEDPTPTNAELADVEAAVGREYKSLIAPPTPGNNRLEVAMNTAGRVWTLVDGLLLGYKLYRKFTPGGKRKKR